MATEAMEAMEAMEAVEAVQGLTYHADFLTEEEEEVLLEQVDARVWNETLSRRTQHYGYVYQYKKGGRLEETTPLPEEWEWLLERVQLLCDEPVNQILVNEYLPGQGISPHTDAKTFGETVVSVSVGSGCVMDFSRDGEKHPVVLEARSAAVLQGDARWGWKHGIVGRKSDVVGGVRVARGRRVSLTFRHVKE
jgi:alkylated DNA repair dioxygenase AlkB